MDTEQRLAEIETRCNAATPGLWMRTHRSGQSWPEVESTGVIRRHICRVRLDDAIDHADGQFIAHAREDVPWLVAELRRARAVVEAARAHVYDCPDTARVKTALAAYAALAPETPTETKREENAPVSETTTVTCDRCGREKPPCQTFAVNVPFTWTRIAFQGWHVDPWHEREPIDLCPACAEAFAGVVETFLNPAAAPEAREGEARRDA